MPNVELGEADNGRSVQVRQGDEITLRLPENATTGYRWQMQRTDEGIEELGDSYEVGSDPKVGGGGIRVLKLRATGAGTTRIELKLLQAWEGEKSVNARFSVNIDVAQ